MGVDIGTSTSPWKIHLKYWNQTRGDNMHSKIMVVDGEQAWVGSINMQDSQTTGPVEWGESGCTLHSGSLLGRMRRYFFRIFNHPSTVKVNVLNSKPYKGVVKCSTYQTITTFIKAENVAISSYTPVLFEVEAIAFGSMPISNIWNRKLNKMYIPLIHALCGASKSIRIFTPNFNDITIWRILEDVMIRKNVKVYVITGKNFNDMGAVMNWISHHCVSFRLNTHMLKHTVIPSVRKHKSVRNNLSFKWYGYDQKAFVRKWAIEGHDKVVMIDDNIVSIGSFNITAVSMLNASENIVISRSREFTKHVWDTFGKRKWDHGESVLNHSDQLS
jgi:HKD family nuclease